MGIPALDELVRIDLQRLRDSYFWWLIVCTAVVAVGVVLEEAEYIFHFLVKPRLDISTGMYVPPYRRVAALKWVTKLGWILIVVGVVGEGVFESLVSRADRLFDNIQHHNTLQCN
jgi:hypothetical protein